jgi:hypothetical protein
MRVGENDLCDGWGWGHGFVWRGWVEVVAICDQFGDCEV